MNKITLDEARNIYVQLFTAERYDINEFNKGLNVEMEHYDAVGGDMIVLGKLVIDHMKEDPFYYTHAEQSKAKVIKGNPLKWNDLSKEEQEKLTDKEWTNYILEEEVYGHRKLSKAELARLAKKKYESGELTLSNPSGITLKQESGETYYEIGRIGDEIIVMGIAPNGWISFELKSEYNQEIVGTALHTETTDTLKAFEILVKELDSIEKYRGFKYRIFSPWYKKFRAVFNKHDIHSVKANPVGPRGGITDIQSFLFERKSWTPTRAKAWAKKHGKKYGDMFYNSRFIILRQYDEAPNLEYRPKKLGKKKGLYALYRIYDSTSKNPKLSVITPNPSGKIQLSGAEPININPGVPLPPGFLPKRTIPGHSLAKRRIEQEMSLRQRYHPSKAVMFDEYFGKGQQAVETLMEGSELYSEDRVQTLSYVSDLIQKTVERRVLKLHGSVLSIQIQEDSIGFRPPEEGSGLLWGIYRVNFRDGSRSAGRFSIDGGGNWDRFHFLRVRLN